MHARFGHAEFAKVSAFVRGAFDKKRLPRNITAILLLLVAGLVMPTSSSVAEPADPSHRCVSMKGGKFLKLPEASTYVTEAAFHARTEKRRAHCEVTAYVNPQVFLGVMIPDEGWNGRYIFRGCGGSCGMLATEYACGQHVADGYACVFTNMGHFGSQVDNHWAQGSLQNQIDFGYRATHVAHVAGQAIASDYLGRKPDYTYYLGCSTGGRQAMVSAQRFPEDFDGLVSIAPVNMANFGRETKIPLSINLRNGKAILTDRDMPLLYRAVMKKCDMNDGVRDGLVNPGDCRFDPAELMCKAGQTGGQCLSKEKVDVARAFYKRGAQLGSELNWIDNWTADAQPEATMAFSQDRGEPSTSDTFYNAGNPDLTALRDHGAKLILAHGTTDLVVPSADATNYYETATRTMGGIAEIQKFFRYFPIIGMDHCSGGDGAWAINYLPIIEKWVEQGEAPDVLIGKRPKPGAPIDYFGFGADRLTPDQVAFTRPYFPYPAKAYYSGRGDPDDAANFVVGSKPTGAQASAKLETLKSRDLKALTAEINAIAQQTEIAYKTAGLPDKNVSDRVGKQLRFTIYNSDLPRDLIAAAIDGALAVQPSAISRNALTIMKKEFSAD